MGSPASYSKEAQVGVLAQIPAILAKALCGFTLSLPVGHDGFLFALIIQQSSDSRCHVVCATDKVVT